MTVTTILTILALSQAATWPTPEDTVMLDDYGPCGLTSLYVVCQIRQVPVEWEKLKELIGPVAPDGSHSFADLSRAALALGMNPVGLHVSRKALHELPMPAIVQVHDPRDPGRREHLLVLLRPKVDGVSLLDPPYPAYFLSDAQFAYTWTGNILVFAHDKAEAEQIRGSATTDWGLRPITWGSVALGILAGLFILRRWRTTLQWMASVSTPIRSRGRLATMAGVGLAACGLVVGYWLLIRPNTSQAAQCVFDSPVIDLGELPPGHLKHSVPVRNAGAVPLRVSKVLSSCTCATVKVPDVIEPGQSSVLEVDLNIPPGPQGARITIESNDPEGPKTVSLHWHGTATPKLIPHKVEAQRLSIDRPYQRTLHLVYPGGKSAPVPRLERCECDSPLVYVQPGKNEPLAKRFARAGLLSQVLGEQELHVKVRPPSKPGSFTARCKLYLKYGGTDTILNLPLWLEFEAGDLKPEVGSVVFSGVSADEVQGQERLVHFRNATSDMELIVRDVPPWLGCDIVRPSGEPPAIRLKILKSPAEPLSQTTLRIGSVREPEHTTPLQVSVFVPSR